MKHVKNALMLHLVVAMISLPVIFGSLWAADEIMIFMGKVDSSGILTTETGEVYLIQPDEHGKEVVKHSPKVVIVTGRLLEKDGKQVIAVHTYQVVEKTSGGEGSDS